MRPARSNTNSSRANALVENKLGESDDATVRVTWDKREGRKAQRAFDK